MPRMRGVVPTAGLAVDGSVRVPLSMTVLMAAWSPVPAASAPGSMLTLHPAFVRAAAASLASRLSGRLVEVVGDLVPKAQRFGSAALQAQCVELAEEFSRGSARVSAWMVVVNGRRKNSTSVLQTSARLGTVTSLRCRGLGVARLSS